MKNLKEILKDQEIPLTEDRPTHIVSGDDKRGHSGIFNEIRKMPGVEKVIQDVGLADGRAMLIRTTDGNAYEIQIRPASSSTIFPNETKSNERAERLQQRKEANQNRPSGSPENERVWNDRIKQYNKYGIK